MNILMLVLLSHAIFCRVGRVMCHHYSGESCPGVRIVVNTEERAYETDH